VWHYLTFAPSAVGLFVLVAMLAKLGQTLRADKVWSMAVVLWLVSWAATVALLYSRSNGSLINDFVPQRDLGYWLGSALLASAPFLIVTGVGQFLVRSPRIGSSLALALTPLAVLGWLLLPGLFTTGWVFGCVAFGYHSCL
jgi:hypothetical protein